MSYIITIQDFFEEFGISPNINDNRVTASIREAQDFDIKQAIGAALFQDILVKYNTSPKDALAAKLVEGGTYVDCNGNTIAFAGLGMALKYYALARFRVKQPINDTRFGVVRKNDQYSESLENKQLMQSVLDAKSAGAGYVQEALRYLESERDLYPLFTCKKGNIRIPITTIPTRKTYKF